LTQEWQKSPTGTRQTDGKNMIWFGEIERKLAKLSNYFYLPFFLLIILWYINEDVKIKHLNKSQQCWNFKTIYGG
jgi:hypothetical protein